MKKVADSPPPVPGSTTKNGVHRISYEVAGRRDFARLKAEGMPSAKLTNNISLLIYNRLIIINLSNIVPW